MQSTFDKLRQAISHLETLYETFENEENFNADEEVELNRYKENINNLNTTLSELGFDDQIYGSDSRQMILADLVEYIFLGRGYYSIKTTEDKEKFVKAILYFVNTLMAFEDITVSNNLRKKFFRNLKDQIPSIEQEERFQELENFEGIIGLPASESDADTKLNRYFDKMLPKTAGGLWHELLVFIFMLRKDFGYIIPLLLTQRFYSREKHLVPPDFLIITHTKDLFGIEVGTKKEIQSGSFSFKTNIPTATVDTINSRSSDRCPSCKKWIQFCPHVIQSYSNFDGDIGKAEIKCLDECSIYNEVEITAGECPYTKYRRNRASTLEHSHHDFANGYHYHYKCVLSNVEEEMEQKIIDSQDNTALKTHYPYYQGLENLK